MLHRGSISILLTAVIGVLAAGLILLLASNTLAAWRQMQTANRIEAVAAISGDVFRAMHTLRTERATISTQLTADSTITSEMLKYIRGIQELEIPAIDNLLAGLSS